MSQVEFCKEMNKCREEAVRMSIENLLEDIKVPNRGDLSMAIQQKVLSILPRLGSHLTFSKLENLIPLVVYLELKVREYSFERYHLHKYSALTKTELNHFLLQLIAHMRRLLC